MEFTQLNPENLPAGMRSGPWRLVRKLARGAFCTVYPVETDWAQPSASAALKLGKKLPDYH